MWRLFAVLLLCATPAMARQRFPAYAPAIPSEHQMASIMAGKERPAYAMSYADEAAQSLGVRGGRWDAFDTGTSSSDPFMPALRGGVDRGGAMIRLQWR